MRSTSSGKQPAHHRVCTALWQVCSVAEEILKTEYDAVRVIFNKFQSAISYKPTIATVLSPDVSVGRGRGRAYAVVEQQRTPTCCS